MKLTLKMPGNTSSRDLREQAAACAQRTLGRLAQQVTHVAVALREHAHRPGGRVDVCTLRLCVNGSRDILVESLRPGPAAAISGAFRQARRELMRRRRASRGAPRWRARPLPAPA